MRKLLMEAYNLKAFQLKAPSWIENEFFDIDARVPTGADLNQFRLTLQRLLMERFQLKARQSGQVYKLILAKNGPKLKPSAAADSKAKPVAKESIGPDAHPLLHRGPDGIVELPAAMHGKGHLAFKTFEGVEIRVQHEGLEYLVERLVDELERPVIDKIGITGQFDYTLNRHGATRASRSVFCTPVTTRPETRINERSHRCAGHRASRKGSNRELIAQ